MTTPSKSSGILSSLSRLLSWRPNQQVTASGTPQSPAPRGVSNTPSTLTSASLERADASTDTKKTDTLVAKKAMDPMERASQMLTGALITRRKRSARPALQLIQRIKVSNANALAMERSDRTMYHPLPRGTVEHLLDLIEKGKEEELHTLCNQIVDEILSTPPYIQSGIDCPNSLSHLAQLNSVPPSFYCLVPVINNSLTIISDLDLTKLFKGRLYESEGAVVECTHCFPSVDKQDSIGYAMRFQETGQKPREDIPSIEKAFQAAFAKCEALVPPLLALALSSPRILNPSELPKLHAELIARLQIDKEKDPLADAFAMALLKIISETLILNKVEMPRGDLEQLLTGDSFSLLPSSDTPTLESSNSAVDLFSASAVDLSVDSKEKEVQTLGDLDKIANDDQRKAAAEAFLKKVEESNPDKYRKLVEAVKKDLARTSKYQFETSSPQWRLAWIARETYEQIPLPVHDHIPSGNMKGYRQVCINSFTPSDCIAPSHNVLQPLYAKITKNNSIASEIHHLAESTNNKLLS